MSRFNHVLSKTGVRQWPDAVVCVQAKTHTEYKSEYDDTGTLSVLQWVACLGRITAGQIEWVNWAKGANVPDWWTVLTGWCNENHRVWIVSADARDMVAVLGVWTMLGDQSLIARGADPYALPREHGNNENPRGGYIVLEAPPTIVCFREPDEATTYVWLDVANWGSGAWSELEGQQSTCHGKPVCSPGDPAIVYPAVADAVCCVKQFVDDYFQTCTQLELGPPENTVASQAMSGFRRSYMDHKIVVHDSRPVLALERRALYGGRCECRFVGELNSQMVPALAGDPLEQTAAIRDYTGPIYHYDVNSLYPAVAQHARLPVRLIGVEHTPKILEVLMCAEQLACVADVWINTDVPCVPCRILRHGTDERDVSYGQYNGEDCPTEYDTIYPVGQFATTLCGPELILAARMGAKMSCSLLAVYDAKPIYRRWVETLYDARRRASDSGSINLAKCVKSLLNASFGKWASWSRRWVDMPKMISREPYAQWYGQEGLDGPVEQFRSMAWHVEKLVRVGEPPDSFPLISAYINALGRVRLWQLETIAGGENVYYLDTDSLWVNCAGKARLEQADLCSETALGGLKLVGEHNQVRFFGRQAYVADGKLTMAGVESPSQWGGGCTVESLRQPSLSYYLWRHEQPDTDRHVAKCRINRPYRHGHVQPDGSVLPIRMDAANNGG